MTTPSKMMKRRHGPLSWWLTRPDEIRAFLDSLKGVRVEEIGETAGGRKIIAARWGRVEKLRGKTSASLASALAAGDPDSFYGKGCRKRQVVCFVGAVHGLELEGTVAMLNFLNVLVTGRDLRGKPQPSVAEAGRKHTWLVIPILNVDGRERVAERTDSLSEREDDVSTMGMLADGTPLKWPDVKRFFPIPSDARLLGSYFNDAGVNLVYDTPFAGDCQPETTSLVRYCRRTLPDCVVFSHSNNGTLVETPYAFLPARHRRRVYQIGAAVGMRCAREGYPKFNIPQDDQPCARPEHLYQPDGVYHASGALPLLVEFPCKDLGVKDNHGLILDIGMTVLEELSVFGTLYGFRPVDPTTASS